MEIYLRSSLGDATRSSRYYLRIRDFLWQEGKELSLAMAAAESLGIIVRDAEVGLNQSHHAVVRPLYKQRFFNSMLSPLLEAVQSSRNTSAK